LEFKYCFILQLLESLYLQPELLFQRYWSRCFQLLLEFFLPPELLFSVASALSEPLSESPSTIAAVTKDKILSIDLEASSFDGTTYFTRIRVSINHCKNWNV
jgi:hypothetical protein